MTRSKSGSVSDLSHGSGSLKRCPLLRRPARRATKNQKRREHIRTDLVSIGPHTDAFALRGLWPCRCGHSRAQHGCVDAVNRVHAVRASPEACRCDQSPRRCEMQSQRKGGLSRRKDAPEIPHNVVELNRADGLSRDLEITNWAERRLREHTREKTSPPANARAKRAQLSERPNESVWRPCAAASEAYEAQASRQWSHRCCGSLSLTVARLACAFSFLDPVFDALFAERMAANRTHKPQRR